MDEEISIINSNTRIASVKKFFSNNKKKLIILLCILLISIVSIIILKEVKQRDKIELSNKYNEAILNYNNGNLDKTKNILSNIILENDKTYSPLALYFLIDNKLIVSKEIINKNFDKIINNVDLDDEIRFLIIYKKALFNSDVVAENELLDILSPITNSESIWKSHSLYLLGEFFMSKNEKQKAKEFYETILTLKNSNNRIRALAEKRIRDEFDKK